MDAQNFIQYELVNLISDQNITTDSREEAIAYYEEGWTVVEHSVTITIPSPTVSAKEIISVKWDENTDFDEVHYENEI